MIQMILILGFFIIVSAPSAGTYDSMAESPVSPSINSADSLTLREYIALALANSSEMKQIEIDLLIAMQQHRQAVASRLPTLSLNLTTPSINSSTDRIQRFTGEGYQEWQRRSGRLGSTFSLTQSLPTGGSVGISSNVSKMQIEESIPGFEPSESQNFASDLVVDFNQPLFGANTYRDELYHASSSVRLAELEHKNSVGEHVHALTSEYLSYVKNVHRNEYLRASIERTSGLLEKAEDQFKDGVIPELEYLQAKIDYSNVMVSQLEAAEDAAKLRRSLLRKLGPVSSENTLFSFNDSFPKEKLAFSLEQYRTMALERRADLSTLRIGRETALYDLGTIKKERGFSTSVQASAGWKGSGEYIREGMDNFGFNLWSVNLVLSVPIWDGGLSRAKLREAEYQVNTASIGIEEKERDIVEEVTEYYFIALNARKKLGILEKTLIMAEKNYRIAEEMFEGGVYSLDALMEADVNLHDAEVNVSDALADFNLAVYDLRRASGLDILPDQKINE